MADSTGVVAGVSGALPLTLVEQAAWLLLLAMPIASIAWTVTHEEIFREPREVCEERSKNAGLIVARKFFYLFTCEYCFSHYVTAAFVVLADFRLLLPGWRGYLLAGFALVWVANVYMSLFALIRVDLKAARVDASVKECELEKKDAGSSDGT